MSQNLKKPRSASTTMLFRRANFIHGKRSLSKQKKSWELDQTRQAWQRRSQKRLNSKRVAASYQQTVPRSSWIKKLPNNESKATSPKPDCRTIVPARRPVKRKGLGLRDTRFTYLTWDVFHKWTQRLGRKKCLQEDHAERSKNKENRPRKHSKITQSQH